MEPNSLLLPILVALVAGGLLVVLARYRHLAIRIACGVVSFALAATVGIFAVNDYYGYYQSWSQLASDLSGYQGQGFTPTQTTTTSTALNPGSGRVVQVYLPGAHSGINRKGLVYLPPQYFQPQYAHTQFPAVELLHGSPGSPSTWIVHLGLATVADRLIDNHLMGPMILVLPEMSVGRTFQDGVNGPSGQDETYLVSDVRADIESRFRVSTVAAEWGVGGYSSGGYAAANLALRHLSGFGASGIMDGYFRPQDGPAAAALHFNGAAEAANDPLRQAAALNPTTAPLPSFWLSAGTGNAGDLRTAKAFAEALSGIETVPFYQVPGAGHNFYAWEPAVPYMLQWMWDQLAPPALRVQFPIRTGIASAKINLTPTLLAAEKAKTACQVSCKRLTPPVPHATTSGGPAKVGG